MPTVYEGAANAPALELRKVSKSFGGAHALREVDFVLLPGEVHALAGMNGAGKSTLVEIVCGALVPDGGEILMGGGSCPALTPRRARALGVSIVHQKRTLVPDLTVAENILLGRLPRRAGRVDWSTVRAEAAQALGDLGIEVPVGAVVGDLTPAQQTLVEIAREVHVGGRILILDEPTAALGGADASRIHDLVRELRSRGTAVVYISHHLDEVLALADRITVMRDGRTALTEEIGNVDLPVLVRAMTGDRPVTEPAGRNRTAGPPALELNKLGGDRLRDFDLTIRTGEIVAVLGPAGDAQRELFPLLAGVRQPSSGTVHVGGARLRSGSVRASLSAGLRCVTGDRLAHGLVPGLSVDENLALADRGMKRPWLVRWVPLHRRAADTRRRYGVITLSADPAVDSLSGGNQQKVLLAKWLDTETTVCLLEEPTGGVDVAAKADIHRMVDELADRGAAVLLTSADVDEVRRLADRVVVVRGGRAVAELHRDDVSRDDLVSLTVGGHIS
ncbi:sugar ABC transporter ATP-binding protein [Streptomyces sp. NPDC093252]|uniref:sugar ABC transporter ATP-binding protein n=1 Tax=Streptomyces sp. NPDC093252 TaxID=3154980 RepID=UPI00341C8FA3